MSKIRACVVYKQTRLEPQRGLVCLGLLAEVELLLDPCAEPLVRRRRQLRPDGLQQLPEVVVPFALAHLLLLMLLLLLLLLWRTKDAFIDCAANI